jgi:microcystin-dependent protein
MSEPFVGEIRMFAGNFAPRGWAFCDGQLLAVSQNDALFSLLGTVYGGDGRTTFGLPELRGRIPIHAGAGPGLTPRQLGVRSGEENVTITQQTSAAHTHQWGASGGAPQNTSPIGALVAKPTPLIFDTGAPSSSMSSSMVDNTGGSRSHNNEMPFLCINFIIALVGIYPSRQ